MYVLDSGGYVNNSSSQAANRPRLQVKNIVMWTSYTDQNMIISALFHRHHRSQTYMYFAQNVSSGWSNGLIRAFQSYGRGFGS